METKPRLKTSIAPEIIAVIFIVFFLMILASEDEDEKSPEKFSTNYKNLETMDDQPDKVSDASIIPCNPSPRFIPRKIKAVGVSIRG
jgi:hypothetical protein